MRKIVMALLVLAAFSSCRVLRPSLMLKTPKNYAFEKVSDTMLNQEYRLAPTDAVSFKILSNEGFKLVDLASNQTVQNFAASTIETTVEADGTIKVPLIGRIKVAGLTKRETEQLLETRFSEFYVGPYILLQVTNKRVIIFPGNAGAARVVTVTNNNTTVFEVLAMAGGITEDGKAYKVKLVRKADPKPKVYLMDLSTIDGLREGNVVVLANDIIYVEPRNRIGQRLSTEVLPYVSLLSSIFIIYSLYARTK